MSFGSFIRDLREKQGMTLRRFCREHGHDPSNFSKIERGSLPPPRDGDTLAQLAGQLGIDRDSGTWTDFMIEASVSRGEIPPAIMGDEELRAALPALFGAMAGTGLTAEQLAELVAHVAREHGQDWRCW